MPKPIVANKVKRGDIVAIEVNHSYHSLTEGRQTYKTAHLAQVESVSREGLAKFITLGAGYRSIAADHAGLLLTITGHNQPIARRMWDSLTRETNEFPDIDALKAALIKAGATRNPEAA